MNKDKAIIMKESEINELKEMNEKYVHELQNKEDELFFKNREIQELNRFSL